MVGKVTSDGDVAFGAGSANIQGHIGRSSRNVERSLVLSMLEGRFAFGNGFDEPWCRRANWKSPSADNSSFEGLWRQRRVGAFDVLEILGPVSSGISRAGGDPSSESCRSATSRINSNNGEDITGGGGQVDDFQICSGRGESLGSSCSSHSHLVGRTDDTRGPACTDINLMGSSVPSEARVHESSWGTRSRSRN